MNRREMKLHSHGLGRHCTCADVNVERVNSTSTELGRKER